MNTYAFVQLQPIQTGFPQYSQPYYGPVGLPPLYHTAQVSPQLQPYYYASPQQQFYRLTPLLPLPLQGFPQQQYGTSLHVQYPQTGSTPSPFALERATRPSLPKPHSTSHRTRKASISKNQQAVPAFQQPRVLPTPPGLRPLPRYATRPILPGSTPPVVDQAQLGQPAPLVDYQHAQGQPAPLALNRHAQGPPTPPQNDQHACGELIPPVHAQHSQRHPTSPTHIQRPQDVPPPPRPPRRQALPVTFSIEHRADVPAKPKVREGDVHVVIRRDPAVEEWTRRSSSTGAVEGSSTYARSTVSGSHGTQAAPLSTASQRSSSASIPVIPQNDMPEIPSEDDPITPSLAHVKHAVIQQESIGKVQPQIRDDNLVYNVTCLLGKGSFGRVGKALIVRNRKCKRCGDTPCASHGVREVAIKTFNLRELATNELIRDTYEQEMEAWKYITKKRARWLMHLWSVFTDNINSYLVMKRCYVSLEDVIDTPSCRDTFNRRAQRLCVEELVQGVEELHRLRMIHRDLKPANVLIDENGHIVITDFGLAEKAPRSSSSLPFYQVEFDRYAGSPGYMAPEVVACKSDQWCNYTCAADLWSLGAIIFEIFMGDRCFTGQEKSKLDWDIALANMYRRTMCWVPQEAQMMILKASAIALQRFA
ncbi:hypothetical protein EWM64_g1231 [Hericium alpestre]|uniref:Protein kinase domain-containing protein n=1 Tax=Hericium alpestre TaxID=135208 RepID=A0A4Z0A6U9_9AGAM|nr:hypothetical protein EWM64_g1231 [Hericium alpestre]